MDPTRPAQAHAPADPARQAARRLEAAFAAEMVRAARPPRREGALGGGLGSSDFDYVMDEALGAALAARGGLGLEKPITEAIRRSQGTRAKKP